ncbi:AAEL017243-PA [Aedes aegypti]|uniref:AAEL017243-PA n=1 Tax=Aedes aegypti TaxID=7159 RepID=J9HSF0_AEDAE|nr:AAEL017243-PA [Aedes aegypti]
MCFDNTPSLYQEGLPLCVWDSYSLNATVPRCKSGLA